MVDTNVYFESHKKFMFSTIIVHISIPFSKLMCTLVSRIDPNVHISIKFSKLMCTLASKKSLMCTAMVGGVVVRKCVTQFYVLAPFYFCAKLMCILRLPKYTLVRCPDWHQHIYIIQEIPQHQNFLGPESFSMSVYYVRVIIM
jgi:hypothetical protein